MFLSEPPVDDLVRTAFAASEAADGYVPNYQRVWAWRQDVAEVFLDARQLLGRTTSLTPRDVAVINACVARARDCSYCAVAWGTRLAAQTDAHIAAGVLQGSIEGLDERDRALAHLAATVASDPNAVTPADLQALRDVGLDDRDIAEATMFAAFRLAFMAYNDALGALPDAQLTAAAPPAVLDAVTFGRLRA